MTLSQVMDAARASLAQRFTATDDELLRWVSQAQRAAFSMPCQGFLRNNFLGTPVYESQGEYKYAYPLDAREIFKLLNAGGTEYFVSAIERLVYTDRLLPDSATCLYYIQPQDLEVETDDDLVLVPENWKYRVLVTGAQHFAETENYSDQSTLTEWQTVLNQFWAEMNRWEPRRRDPVSKGAW
jgi:hypothetical protein